MTIGVLGGAFNPIHNGHLAVAQSVADQLGFERILFVVSRRPPHKEEQRLIDTADRYRMVEIACAADPRFVPSSMEIHRAGPSYTVDTLAALDAIEQQPLAFIIGMDAFAEIGSWKKGAQLLVEREFVVVTRPGYDQKIIGDTLRKVVPVRYNIVSRNIDDSLDRPIHYQIGSAGSVTALRIPGVAVSSTGIRQRLQKGEPVTGMVPEPVADYLADHHIGPRLTE
jgi:nicotinate-nucleotide adenylyltransferase